MHCHCRKRPNE
jgi:hypothetical protein